MTRTVLVWSLLGYLSVGLLTLISLLTQACVQRISINWRQEYKDILIVTFLWPYAWLELYRNACADREWRRQLVEQREARRLESERQNAALPEYRPYYKPAPPAPSVPAQPVRAPRKIRKAVLRRQHGRRRPW